jgi:dihydroxyacetone kinase, phosphotransfer subunit
MVGMVVVSHSPNIVKGIAEVASQMAPKDIPMAYAGGTNDGRIGTDADKITEAINSVYSPDGVIVLYDLGSALMSAEIALEFLSEEERQNIYVSDAPIVEGAIIAAVEIGLNKNLEEVKATLSKMGSKRDWT